MTAARFNVSAIFGVLLFTWAGIASACERPYVFFDLGGTIVDTKNNTFKDMTYMNEARAYVAGLAEQGYPMGMLINWPEKEGSTLEEKRELLRRMVDDGWSKSEDRFDWDQYELGLHLSLTDDQRKDRSLYLFLKAVRMAEADGCPAIFEGEDAKEVESAREAGMFAYQVQVAGRPAYLPLSRISEVMRLHRRRAAGSDRSGR